MADSDISEYTYERTLIMEQRNEMLKEMKVSDKRAKKMVSGSRSVVVHSLKGHSCARDNVAHALCPFCCIKSKAARWLAEQIYQAVAQISSEQMNYPSI